MDHSHLMVLSKVMGHSRNLALSWAVDSLRFYWCSQCLRLIQRLMVLSGRLIRSIWMAPSTRLSRSFITDHPYAVSRSGFRALSSVTTPSDLLDHSSFSGRFSIVVLSCSLS